MMKRVVFEFLNLRFKDKFIWCQKHHLSDKTIEKFMTNDFEGIIDFTRFNHGKDIRTRVMSNLRGHIKNYIGIEYIDIDMYVLDWCKDKVKTVDVFD